MKVVHIVGGGLAGCEAAYQCLKRGVTVVLHEMRPTQLTPAHKTGQFAELVCSNSLKSMAEDSAPGLLKSEMEKMGSLILKAALHAKVPAGQALAVDRMMFSSFIENELRSFPNFQLSVGEVQEIPSFERMKEDNSLWIIASGPLTSDRLVNALAPYTGAAKNLYFYDAIAPVLETDSIDLSKAYWANRYEDDGDYLNIPLTKTQYDTFIQDVLTAEKMPLHDFEKPKYFESCLPIEVMAERGPETLRFGPMKPVGIVDPATGQRPYANIQLRKENADGSIVSMVGFQTKMKWPEQKRVFSKIPAFEHLEFLRYGSVHRNTFINSPKVLNADFSFKSNLGLFLAGQISGVEGYTESTAIGLLVGTNVASIVKRDRGIAMPPETSMIGALHHYVTQGSLGDYQPMNTNFGLLPPLLPTGSAKKIPKHEKKGLQVQRALSDFSDYFKSLENF